MPISISQSMPCAGLSTLLLSGTAAAQVPCQPTFDEGARTLFIGHSFFVPIAREFDRLAVDNGFPAHTGFDSFFSGGDSGSPGMLWDDADGSRTAIEGKLSEDIELFGLTVGSEPNSELEDYVLWIDLVRSHNPDVRVLIGMPWVPYGPSMSASVFDQLVETTDDQLLPIVAALRDRYPENQIDFVNYGKVASTLYLLFEAGELPDVTCVEPSQCEAGGTPLFTDANLGHGGTMVKELSALVWLNVLYGADVRSLEFTDYEADAAGVVEQVLSYNCDLTELPCAGDLADSSGFGTPDGVVDSGDFFAMSFRAGPCGFRTPNPLCVGDLSDSSGFGPADGAVDFGDFFALSFLAGPCE